MLFQFLMYSEVIQICVCAYAVASVMSDSFRPNGPQPSRQEYWSGLPSLLQGIFPTQGSNLCLLHLLHCKVLYCQHHLGSLHIYNFFIFFLQIHYGLLQNVEHKYLCSRVELCCLLIFYVKQCLSVNPKLIIYFFPLSLGNQP